jgi:hypothetical protein
MIRKGSVVLCGEALRRAKRGNEGITDRSAPPVAVRYRAVVQSAGQKTFPRLHFVQTVAPRSLVPRHRRQWSYPGSLDGVGLAVKVLCW